MILIFQFFFKITIGFNYCKNLLLLILLGFVIFKLIISLRGVVNNIVRYCVFVVFDNVKLPLFLIRFLRYLVFLGTICDRLQFIRKSFLILYWILSVRVFFIVLIFCLIFLRRWIWFVVRSFLNRINWCNSSRYLWNTIGNYALICTKYTHDNRFTPLCILLVIIAFTIAYLTKWLIV